MVFRHARCATPRHPPLGKAYRAALEIVASLRADAESEIEFGDLVSTAQRDPAWVSLWAAEPGEVQQCLLEMLAPIELQLDKFHFERGATPPRR